MFLRITVLLFTLLGCGSYAQNYNAFNIPKELTENANAVVRYEKTDIVISSRKSLKRNYTRVVTVLNEYGEKFVYAAAHYDKSSSVKSIDAQIFDKNGELIKKIKRKDFKDRSTAQADVSDDRMLYLDYTASGYPYTVVFNSETESSTTAFLAQWSPVEGTFCSSEKEEITVTVEPSLGFKFKEYNFGDLVLNKTQTGNTYTFSTTNIPAYRGEDYAPSLDKTKPVIMMGLDKFNLEGVDGEATSWEGFGTWMYNNLLQGTDELPEATVAKVKAMVANETDDLAKAKIIYKYVQSRTRYVSIQLGIGGWKPMLAKDVDRLGYGDCKALSNYTRALLKAAGVTSYYTVVYAGTYGKDMKQDFVSMQGNHVILAIPYNNELVWLECTSQSIPFGFQGDFTDNRLVLVVKPEKSEIVRTHVYKEDENTQFTKGTYAIMPDGQLKGSFKRVSKGLQYDDKFMWERSGREDLDKMYKQMFSYINNLKLGKTDIANDYDGKQFTEDIALEAAGYANTTGGRLMFAVNTFNHSDNVPQRYRSRKMPLSIGTGFYDEDEVTIQLPEGFTMEAMPQNTTITDKYGEYKTEYTVVSPTQLLYKRTLLIKRGDYEKEDYDKYREFREKISRNDNAKVVLVKQ